MYQAPSGLRSNTPGTDSLPPVASFIQLKNCFSSSGDLKDIDEFGLGVPNGYCSAFTGPPKYVSLKAKASKKGFKAVGIADLAAFLARSLDSPKLIGEKAFTTAEARKAKPSRGSLSPAAVSTATVPIFAKTLYP